MVKPPKKSTPTYHPLRMAKSLEVQNDAVGFLLMSIATAAAVADEVNASAAQLAALLKGLRLKADDVRAVLWPDEE